MMKRIYFIWKHSGKRDYVTIDDRSQIDVEIKLYAKSEKEVGGKNGKD